MRIGLFTDTYLPYVSGVVTAVDGLKKGLEELEHEVYVISLNGDEGKKKYKLDGNIVKIPGTKTPKNLYDYYFRVTYPNGAVKLVKDLDLDIVHTHTEGMMGIFGKSIAKKINVPVVHTFHTMYEDCINYITKGHFDKLGKKGAKAFVTTFLTKTVSRVIVPGEKPKRLLKDKYKIKQDVVVIPSGIEIQNFDSSIYSEKDIDTLKKKYGIKKNDFVILWVGRLGYEKNIQFLIQCHKELVKENKNIKLMIVGGGPEEENLKKQASELGILDNVIFVGKVPNKEVSKYYKLASVFASASRFETQGLTLIEAFAAGLPVLAIDDPSFIDIVSNNKNGIIFKDEESYCDAVLYLNKNRKVLNDMSSEAKKESYSYTLEAFASKVVVEYVKALEEYKTNHKYKKSNKK